MMPLTLWASRMSPGQVALGGCCKSPQSCFGNWRCLSEPLFFGGAERITPRWTDSCAQADTCLALTHSLRSAWDTFSALAQQVCVCVYMKPISTSSGEYVRNYIMCKRCFEATLLSSVQRHSTSCQWRYVNSQESYYFSHVIVHIKQLQRCSPYQFLLHRD